MFRIDVQTMICGVDEAGRGPVIGPMVVAGICVESEKGLLKLAVKDSKRHTAGKREELAIKIHDMAKCVVKVVSAEDIDLLRDEMTLNKLEENMFAKIIDEVAVSGSTVYLDAASTDEKGFGDRIKTMLKKDVNIVSKHRADDTYPVVSAASIIAKVRRDEEVAKIAKELGEDFGSGYPSDQRTIDFLKDWVEKHGDLPPHTRRSWKTAQRIMSDSKNTSLDQF